MAEKNILAFGDSLTWGANPETGERHPAPDRWPDALQAALGPSIRVIAEGLGGRTTIYDDMTTSVDKNGGRVLPMLLSTHQPLDLIAIMLGTNDLKPSIFGTIDGAVVGLERLCRIIRDFDYYKGCTTPDILLISPPLFCAMASGEPPRMNRSIAESHKFAPAIHALAQRLGTGFFDAATVAQPSPIDGVHLDAANTRAIGTVLAPLVRARLAARASS